jgi:hypothetical protein
VLSYQTGLTVDRTLRDRQVGRPAGEIDEGARDLLAAFDRAEHGAGEAAAVGDRRGVGVEQVVSPIPLLAAALTSTTRQRSEL